MTHKCRDCGEHKPIAEFPRDRRAKDGRRTQCRSCNTEQVRQWRADNPDRIRQTRKSWWSQNPEKARHYSRKRLYGVSSEQTEEMRAQQHDKCAICNKTFTTTPHLDHCHATGIVRGLLCPRCNTGLGLFGDDPSRLSCAAEYVRRTALAVVA